MTHGKYLAMSLSRQQSRTFKEDQSKPPMRVNSRCERSNHLSRRSGAASQSQPRQSRGKRAQSGEQRRPSAGRPLSRAGRLPAPLSISIAHRRRPPRPARTLRLRRRGPPDKHHLLQAQALAGAGPEPEPAVSFRPGELRSRRDGAAPQLRRRS